MKTCVRSLHVMVVAFALGFGTGVLVRCCVSDARVDYRRDAADGLESNLRRRGFLRRLDDLERQLKKLRESFEEHARERFHEGKR